MNKIFGNRAVFIVAGCRRTLKVCARRDQPWLPNATADTPTVLTKSKLSWKLARIGGIKKDRDKYMAGPSAKVFSMGTFIRVTYEKRNMQNISTYMSLCLQEPTFAKMYIYERTLQRVNIETRSADYSQPVQEQNVEICAFLSRYYGHRLLTKPQKEHKKGGRGKGSRYVCLTRE